MVWPAAQSTQRMRYDYAPVESARWCRGRRERRTLLGTSNCSIAMLTGCDQREGRSSTGSQSAAARMVEGGIRGSEGRRRGGRAGRGAASARPPTASWVGCSVQCAPLYCSAARARPEPLAQTSIRLAAASSLLDSAITSCRAHQLSTCRWPEFVLPRRSARPEQHRAPVPRSAHPAPHAARLELPLRRKPATPHYCCLIFDKACLTVFCSERWVHSVRALLPVTACCRIEAFRHLLCTRTYIHNVDKGDQPGLCYALAPLA